MPLLKPLNRPKSPNSSLLSAKSYDPDASSIRSDQESDSDDDERQARARNSRELRAHDRIVLLEEEEMDQLVIEARRRQDRERERRGSSQRRGTGLSALKAPIRLFSGSRSDDSRSRSPAGKLWAGQESIEDLRGDARKQRRQRRRAKKDMLLEKAKEGEDGELMDEMEQGGLRTGSSVSSSDREYSDELDRRGLKHLADSKWQRTRERRRWSLIYALIAAGFAVLAIMAWKMSTKKTTLQKIPALVSNGTALFAPTTLIISLDGFRADFLQRGITPRLNAFVQEGVSPLYMNPSFPSVTFPNHFTLATGLYPEAHGIVGNSFWDPQLQEAFYYTHTDVSMQKKWWNGEPFWVTAESQGVRTAMHMWPGSEAHIGEFEPAFIDQFNGKEKLSNKVSRIFEFLDRPGMEDRKAKSEDMRPQLIAAYVPNVDADGHKYGPNSTEIRDTIQHADQMLDDIFIGLEARNLTNIVNVIVVSDHGMATTDVSRMIQMDDLVDLSKVAHIDGWPLVGLRPKDPADLDQMHRALVEKAKTNTNFDVYLRDSDMPERYHFANNDRIAPLWLIPKTGWAIVTKEEFDIEDAKATNRVYHPIGLHGYDHEHPLMRAIFVARGPAFPHQPGSRVEPFRNIEVYNILCDSLGLTPAANNGTIRLPLKPVGLHDPIPAIDVPSDPVVTSDTATPSPAPAKPLGVDPVVIDDTSGAVGVTIPAEPSLVQEADEELLEAAEDWWEWAKDEFGKAWSWTSDKAGAAWSKIQGGEDAPATT